jgi:hypothetical protein
MYNGQGIRYGYRYDDSLRSIDAWTDSGMDIVSQTQTKGGWFMSLLMLVPALFMLGTILLGIIIPAVIFIFSFGLTFALYRHFSRKVTDTKK